MNTNERPPDLAKFVGRRIMAGGEPIYQFSTGRCVGRTRRRNIGTITATGEGKIQVFCKSNPKGYQEYELELCDFLKWVREGLYLLR